MGIVSFIYFFTSEVTVFNNL